MQSVSAVPYDKSFNDELKAQVSPVELLHAAAPCLLSLPRTAVGVATIHGF
jgi:hypothetical protein